MKAETVIVGAGAAGLMSAIRSAERGRSTILLEKNRKAGVKILMSGGTRCNITHACDRRGIVEAFGSAGPFLHSALASLGPDELIDLLAAEGLRTKVEPGGKVFPCSDRAHDVLQALLRRLARSGAELALGEPVLDIERTGAAFRVLTPARELSAEKLIITSGGKSYPGCGTTGEGYRWLAKFSHTIRRPRPALVPLTSAEPWVQELAGVTVPSVLLRVVDANRAHEIPPIPSARRAAGKLPPGVSIQRAGSLLFTHFGLSGPAALDVSRAVTAARSPRDVVLIADFLPDLPPGALSANLREVATATGKRLVVSRLGESLPRRLVDALLRRANVPPDRKGAELSKEEREQLAGEIKSCVITLSGTRGFDKAEVTAGGVALDEVDSRTMESKIVPNLYLAGEILDLDGFIGGYNFQAAFSTGWLAGERV